MIKERDILFLREMQGRLTEGRNGDATQLDFVEQMISDWIDELSATKPLREESFPPGHPAYVAGIDA